MTSPMVPDYAEPIIGWRIWRGKQRPDDWRIRLRSAFREMTWEPGRAAAAYCDDQDPGHAIPDWNCRCGIYALRSIRDVREYAYMIYCTPVRVVGKVALWGRVIEHESGFRAEFAYPMRLWIIPWGDNIWEPLVRQAADDFRAYGVPVELLESYVTNTALDELERLELAAA